MAMQAGVAAEDHGLSVGILVSFRLFGALIGLAMGATAFSSSFSQSIATIGLLPASVAILANPSEALGFIPTLRTIDLSPELMDAIRLAYRDAVQVIWYVLTAASGVGFIASLFMEELSLESEEVSRQHFDQPASV